MALILVVDDRPTNREYLALLLSYAGHRVLEAHDGFNAMELTRTQRPDLVITDLNMPGMDGVALVRRMRDDPALEKTNVIFWTATYTLQEAAEMAASVGVVHVLAKPSEPTEVIATVNAALNAEPVLVAEVVNGDSRNGEMATKLTENTMALHRSSARFAALVELNLDLMTDRDPAHMLDYSCKLARDIVGAQSAAIGILTDDARALRYYYSCDAPNSGLAPRATPRPRAGVLGRMLDDRRLVRWTDTDPPSELPPHHGPIRSFLGVPIATPQRAYGWLYFINNLPEGAFGVEEERLAVTLAVQIGTVYENLCLYEQTRLHAQRLEHEVNERKRLESQLERARRLEHLGTMASWMTHDLCQLLVPISMSAEMLESDPSQSMARRLAPALRTSAEAAIKLVRQMSVFSKDAIEPALTDPAPIIRRLVDLLPQTFPSTIHVTSTVPDGLWRVPANPEDLNHLVLALCDEARHAMADEGSLTIAVENANLQEPYVRTQPGARPGPAIVIRVTDSRRGLPPGLIDKIIDPTRPQPPSPVPNRQAMVADTVKGYGGFVVIAADPARGSTTSIYLPAVPTAAVQTPATPSPPPHQPGHGETVLVVDDEVAIREMIGATLETYGYHVVTTGDVGKAATLVAQGSPDIDLVLIDMMSPRDVKAAIHTIQSLSPAARIICGGTPQDIEP